MTLPVPVLDAGALVALERNDRRVWAVLKAAAASSVDVLVPATALAQVWRGGSRQALLGRALDHCVVASFDVRAREIGELCGRARITDVCDAHVALVASEEGDALITSDVADMRHLLRVIGRRRKPMIVRC